MLKRRTTWLGGSASLLLILSLSGVVAGAEPPATEPVVVVDTTATYEDIDGNGIDDDCQDVAAVAAPEAVTAELLTVDVDGNGIISTTEAAHSPRIGGKNCNQGGYVSWIAHQKHVCVVETPVAATPVVEPTVVLVVTTPPDAEPDAEVEACEPEVTSVIAGAKKDKVAAAAARDASKAERALARQATKAARDVSKAERTVVRDTSKADRQAAKAAKQAERQTAKAARAAKSKGH